MENDFRYLKLPLISTTWRNSIEQTSSANISKNNSSHDCIFSICFSIEINFIICD